MTLIIATRHIQTAPGATISTLDMRGSNTASNPPGLTRLTETREGLLSTSRTSARVELAPPQVSAIEDAVRASGLLNIASVAAPAGANTIDFGTPTASGAFSVRVDDRMWTTRDTPDAVMAMQQLFATLDAVH